MMSKVRRRISIECFDVTVLPNEYRWQGTTDNEIHSSARSSEASVHEKINGFASSGTVSSKRETQSR